LGQPEAIVVNQVVNLRELVFGEGLEFLHDLLEKHGSNSYEGRGEGVFIIV
jgi:hypothetical protein